MGPEVEYWSQQSSLNRIPKRRDLFVTVCHVFYNVYELWVLDTQGHVWFIERGTLCHIRMSEC